MAALIGLFVGAILGNLLWHEWGAALGAVAGFLVGAQLLPRRASIARGAPPGVAAERKPTVPGPAATAPLHDRVAELEARVATLEAALSAAGIVAPVPPRSAPPAAPAPSPVAQPLAKPVVAAVPGATSGGAPVTPSQPNPLWRWFTGGNAVARIGAVALFFGVAFLLRYFAERFELPIEWRLGAVAAAGLALTGVGMRVAAARPAYGLTLQGAGTGVLYLTVYAAFRLYDVLPMLPALGLLVAVSTLAVWLAVRSDAQALAGLALAGGFVAPLLIATGRDPVWLFGYFAVLNGAIFALAWKRAWPALNAVGFVFTFGLGAFWGHGFYRPEHYAEVQPFLVLFLAFYVAIAILYARRGPLATKGPVDGLLVFGVPLGGFALQAALVADVRYGAMWSALALAGVYLLLYLALRGRTEPGFPLLARAFLALCAIFTTIAVPFALDNRETAALWAVAAAGAHWIGVKQGARALRLGALVVELAAGVVFVASGPGPGAAPLFANAYFAGALAIALSGLVTAFVADRAGDALPAQERGLVPLVFGWGVLWWLGAGGADLVRKLDGTAEIHGVLAWVTASVALALALRTPLRWARLAAAGIALLPAMTVAALGDFDLERTTLSVFGWAVWPCAWVVHYLALRAADLPVPAGATHAGAGSPTLASRLGGIHAFSALALTAQISWEASEWVGRWTAHYTVWTPCAAALPAIGFLWLAIAMRDGARWPAALHGRAYAKGAGGAVALLLAVWFFVVNVLSPGDASPLPYLPVASPLDITLLLALWALAAWAARVAGLSERTRYAWIGAVVFVALNGVVFRTAHHWADVPWRLGPMLASKPVQAALSVTWTAAALALMYVATKRRLRPLWMLGATLLAAVVVKLFVIDLAALSGLPRVVAFLGVGALLLAIGYVSPLPPAAVDDEAEADGRPR